MIKRGRPIGGSKYGEKTVTLRIPVSLLQEFRDRIDKWLKAKKEEK